MRFASYALCHELTALFLLSFLTSDANWGAHAASAIATSSMHEGEVVLEDVRVQALSPTLLRIEPKGPRGFEDRETLMVANRSFAKIPITAVDKDASTGGIKVQTKHYTVRLLGASCAGEGKDVVDPVRSDGFPDGIKTDSGKDCCRACSTDPSCTSWVYATDGKICYPLARYGSLVDAGNREFGQSGSNVVHVLNTQGAKVYDSQDKRDVAPNLLHWPAPLEAKSYAIVDSPRFTVPPWGATPGHDSAIRDAALKNTNGYDFRNGVDGDTYVFLLGETLSSWEAARSDFLKLTGPVPLLPDFAYGTWFTWWHPYKEVEAKEDIEHWDSGSLPLDVWGLDMNWRYTDNDADRFYDQPNTDRFPDFTEWFDYLKEKKLRTFFNDHPYPVASRGAGGLQTSPEEVAFRWDGLTSWMDKGLDFWWFDVNWGISIPPPTLNQSGTYGHWQGLGNAVWGSHVYYTIVDGWMQQHPDKGDRAIALTKFAGDDARPGANTPKGSKNHPENPSQHRYPVWWTGDNVNLQASVESMVDSSIYDQKPFVHSDCGGDRRGTGTNLLRWIAHCAFGTILRLHGEDHRPWTYDQPTQDALKQYLLVRYRLMPSFIAAGQRVTRSGAPLVERCDLYWPEHSPDSRSNQQYIFLGDLLVAPLLDSEGDTASRTVWIPPGHWQDVWGGGIAVGPKQIHVSQPASQQPMWYRRDGGLLVLVDSDKTRLQDQDWSTLVVELFPAEKALVTHRTVYDRVDTGEAPRTEIVMSTDGDGIVEVQISAPTSGEPRAWTLRVHAPSDPSTMQAIVDGVLKDVPKMNQADDATAVGIFALGRVGVQPTLGSETVAEFHLPRAATPRSLRAALTSAAVARLAQPAPKPFPHKPPQKPMLPQKPVAKPPARATSLDQTLASEPAKSAPASPPPPPRTSPPPATTTIPAPTTRTVTTTSRTTSTMTRISTTTLPPYIAPHKEQVMPRPQASTMPPIRLVPSQVDTTTRTPAGFRGSHLPVKALSPATSMDGQPSTVRRVLESIAGILLVIVSVALGAALWFFRGRKGQPAKRHRHHPKDPKGFQRLPAEEN